MQIELVNGLGKQGLKIAEEPQDGCLADFREQMLIHNEIEGILKFDIHRENEGRSYEYNTFGLEPLQMVCSKHKLARDEVCEILGGILKTVYHGKEFMLVEDDYVIRPDTVFLETGNKVQVAYFSGYRINIRKQLCGLAEFLMDNIEYRDEGAVLLVYSFYTQTKVDNCSLEDLFDVLADNSATGQGRVKTAERNGFSVTVPEQQEKAISEVNGLPIIDQTAFREITPENNFIEPGIMDIVRQSPLSLRIRSVIYPAVLLALLTAVLKSGVLNSAATGKPYSIVTFASIVAVLGTIAGLERRLWKKFSEQLVSSLKSASQAREEATVMLYSDGTAAYPFSLVSDQYDSINASHFPFCIGKCRETSDYCLDKVGVSRQHVRIDREGDGFTITDMQSTNGTFLNSIRLKPYVSEKIRRGDEVRIGSYVYYCN